MYIVVCSCVQCCQWSLLSSFRAGHRCFREIKEAATDNIASTLLCTTVQNCTQGNVAPTVHNVKKMAVSPRAGPDRRAGPSPPRSWPRSRRRSLAQRGVRGRRHQRLPKPAFRIKYAAATQEPLSPNLAARKLYRPTFPSWLAYEPSVSHSIGALVNLNTKSNWARWRAQRSPR